LKKDKPIVDWTKKFEKIFKHRDYGTLKDRERKNK
tara:strand:+ start:343 stop:447 length:105 start_codon:yes stop_codon:yes gene_type:complete